MGGNNPLAGKVVGFEGLRPDGTYVRMRVDYDPEKGTHINVEVGKGEGRKKVAIKFDGTTQQAVSWVEGNFNQ